MKQEILLRKITALIVFALSLALLFYFFPESPIQDESTPLIENTVVLPEQERESFGLPMRLKIPEINVDSVIEYVGLTSDGAMDAPKGSDNVAWFELGPRPGESGSAVIAGHYGWKNGKGSVFDDLHKLRKGDKLYVEDSNGEIISFVVRETRRYDLKAIASEVFVPNDGKSHLNLITCEGVWDEISKTYSQRLVVFADKELGQQGSNVLYSKRK